MLMKIQHRHESHPRRHPVPAVGSEWTTDKGRKHEAFDTGSFGGDRRSMAQVMRLDRKR
jgi:hypothetical protein